MRRKMGKRMVPAVLALSLCMSQAAFAAEAADDFTPGPGNVYDADTEARLKDNVLEYEEIPLLIQEYNQTLKNVRESWRDSKDSSKDVAKLQDQILSGAGALSDQSQQMAGMASMFEDSLGKQNQVTPAAYAQMVYSSELLAQQADQMTLSVDSLSKITPEMLYVKMVDSTKASLTAGAQSAVIGYEQLLLQKQSLNDSLELLEAVYESAKKQAEVGMATETSVITARQNLESAKAGLITLEANETKVVQSLCTMMGWSYNDRPTIEAVPSADMSRIDGMHPEIDQAAAVSNNYTLKYNEMDLANKTDGSVEQQNLRRTIENEKEQVASSLNNLYNDVLQKKSEYETAVAAYDLEKKKMDSAEVKMQVGSIGKLEYLQQKNALTTKEIAVRTADLALFQAMETYDWAVAGNLSLS